MAPSLMKSHVHEEGYKGSLLASVLGHGLLFLIFLFAVEWVPARSPVVIGTGPGGGQKGDFVTVGLSDEMSGGAGMYKPSVTPRPEAVPPPARQESDAGNEEAKEKVLIQKAATKEISEGPDPESSAGAGAIPRPPDPGSGGLGGQNRGTGGGLGGGQGVTIGPGTGEGAMDSWYVRQVEQRVGQNWLKTSLGQLQRTVQTVISFEIQPSGKIDNIQIERKSGIRSIDLAAERAVQASSPLPPVPYEFRRRKMKFVAYFEYPPR